MEIVLQHEGKWEFDVSGRIDTPPKVGEGIDSTLCLSQVEVAAIRRVLFAHAPPRFLEYPR